MIKCGDKLPPVKVQRMRDGRIESVAMDELFAGKRAVLFAVPAAFSPNCSEQHLPGYVNKRFEFKRHGIEAIYCIAVNDVFVMQAWARDQDIVDEITMLADGNGEFTQAVDLALDMSRFGLGLRSKRYAMVVEDGVVTKLFVEKKGGEVKLSKAEHVLEALDHD